MNKELVPFKKLENVHNLFTTAGDENSFEIYDPDESFFSFIKNSFREVCYEIKVDRVTSWQIFGWSMLLIVTFFGGLIGWMYFL